jgi:hypothetical protein
MTAEFTSGRHYFTVNLAAGAVVERLRLERKKDSPADYLATIRRIGFDPGPDGPITRDKAVDAMRFIEGRRKEVLAGPCGDVPPLPSGDQPPLAPPVIPPQQPASPVVP